MPKEEVDEIKALLEENRAEEERAEVRDRELIRVGGALIRLTQMPGWEILKARVHSLRSDLALSILSKDSSQVDYVRGQADGAQKVLDLVQNAIEAAQDALQRIQTVPVAGRARQTDSGALVGE